MSGEPSLQRIAFITGNYPSPSHPGCGTFVRQLVEAVAEQGVDCAVIHPWKIHEWLRERKRDAAAEPRGNGVALHRPFALSFSKFRLGPFSSAVLTHRSFQRAAWRALRSLPAVPDAVYGHFLHPAGSTAIWAAGRLRKPGFAAVGESFAPGDPGLWTIRHVGRGQARKTFAGAAGFVAVSSLLREQLVSELGIPAGDIGVFPNGIDPRKFYPRDRKAMRAKHGLPSDRFLIGFLGSFDARKGIQRVMEALKGLPGAGGVFIGDGPLRPEGEQVLFCGKLTHEQVPEMLSAVDVFVLPSLAEGSSNATLEAMACGLPVIVSTGRFNDDIVTEDCALRVDPSDVGALRGALSRLQSDNYFRGRLAAQSSAQAARFDVHKRADGILAFMRARAATVTN